MPIWHEELTPSCCCGNWKLQWKLGYEVLCTSYKSPSHWCNLTNNSALYDIHEQYSSRTSTFCPPFCYYECYALLTWHNLLDTGSTIVGHNYSRNQSSSNWTLLLRQLVCTATTTYDLPYDCCVYSALSARLHRSVCCTWQWGDHPSHSGIVLVLLSQHSRGQPQV